MARHFLTGRVMPVAGPMRYFQRDGVRVSHRQVPGGHDRLGSEAWLQNMDRHRAEIIPVLESPPEGQALRGWVH